MTFSRLLFCVVAIFFVSACSNTPREASAHYFRYFDFSNVKNYAFYARNNDTLGYQNLSDVTRNSIEFAIENQLDSLGLKYKDIADADVIVSYFWVATKEQRSVSRSSRQKNQRLQVKPHEISEISQNRELSEYNKGVRYCAPCLKLSANGEQVSKINTDEGALIIDLISPKSKRSVWRSSYPVEVKEKDNSQEIQQRIQRAIQEMLLQYPKN